MTDLEAAYHVLAQAGAPLHDAEITRRTLAQSLITPTGRTPEANCMTCSTPYHRNALKRSSPTCCSEASGTQQREGKVMTQADQIRQYVIDRYIQPARLAGQSTVRVNAGAIHSAMQLENRLPAVCSALDADKFFTQAKVTLVQRSGPQQSSTVEWLFALP